MTSVRPVSLARGLRCRRTARWVCARRSMRCARRCCEACRGARSASDYRISKAVGRLSAQKIRVATTSDLSRRLRLVLGGAAPTELLLRYYLRNCRLGATVLPSDLDGASASLLPSKRRHLLCLTLRGWAGFPLVQRR